MSFVESGIDRGIDFVVEKGVPVLEKSLIVAAVAGGLGIGTTAVSLGMMAAEHAQEIARASKWVAGKLVR